jgi:CubicO group peptidase (beta-lactamase class C family)
MTGFLLDSPENQGLDSQKLDTYVQRLVERSTNCLIVMRNDKVVKEWYSAKYTPDTPHYTASLAKTIVGGLALAVAVSEGYMAYDDLACTFIIDWIFVVLF